MNADLATWNAAVQHWRTIRGMRPLGPCFVYPDVPLPIALTSIGPHASMLRDYPAAFITLNRVASGYA